jgi:hypothetical protein
MIVSGKMEEERSITPLSVRVKKLTNQMLACSAAKLHRILEIK